LLIIMMIIAPMLQKGVDVKLPTASNTVDKPETQDQTVGGGQRRRPAVPRPGRGAGSGPRAPRQRKAGKQEGQDRPDQG
jgi:hypothetical protein